MIAKIVAQLIQKYYIDLAYLFVKGNILADTFSCTHLEEMPDDIPEEELTAKVHKVYENALTTKSRLEEIKKTAKTTYEMKQNHIGHLEKNYQSLMELYLKVKDWLYLKL